MTNVVGLFQPGNLLAVCFASAVRTVCLVLAATSWWSICVAGIADVLRVADLRKNFSLGFSDVLFNVSHVSQPDAFLGGSLLNERRCSLFCEFADLDCVE